MHPRLKASAVRLTQLAATPAIASRNGGVLMWQLQQRQP